MLTEHDFRSVNSRSLSKMVLILDSASFYSLMFYRDFLNQYLIVC